MLKRYLKNGAVYRIISKDAKTYRFLWPFSFTQAVPGARPLCRWAARHGATLKSSLCLEMIKDMDRVQCCIITTRTVPKNSVLVSVPLALCMSVSSETVWGRTSEIDFEAVEELAECVVRNLHIRKNLYRPYLEFLYDLHNFDQDTALNRGNHVDARLLKQMDKFYDGNTIRAKGASNGTFLKKGTLQTTPQRANWVRMQNMQRRLEQRVPYFAAKSVAWAISMVLSRAIADVDNGLSLFPLIDFSTHSFYPNSRLVVCKTRKENFELGVSSDDPFVPSAHLVSIKEIEKGNTITRSFDKRRLNTPEDSEYWQIRWGFTPKS